jgi:hypothetical protein
LYKIYLSLRNSKIFFALFFNNKKGKASREFDISSSEENYGGAIVDQPLLFS